MSSAKDVLDFSRAMLDGQRGTIAVLKVFLDESGTHNNSPVVTVAAYIARPKQWAEFTKKWKFAIRPIEIYHAQEAANCRDAFEGWTKEQVVSLAKKALPIIPQYTEMAVAISIQMQDMEKALKERPDLRKILGSPYGCCLHWVLSTILREKLKSGSRERIAFFHEQNDFEQEALETFSTVRKSLNTLNAPISFTFGGKRDYVPLQAADVLAYEANKYFRAIGRPKRKALEALSPDPDRFVIGCYNQCNMHKLIANLERGLALT